jgi:Fic family protein
MGGMFLLSLQHDKLSRILMPVSTGWLLSACMEARGKQDLWIRQKPEVLEVLREQAIIQSAESSNRIEGVIILPNRLRPVVLGKSKPRDRSEEELAGYRKALNWIFSRKRPVPVETDIILHLHTLAQGGFSGDAGEWKRRDNEIIEILPSGEKKTRFKPASAKATPEFMKFLCQNYKEACDEERVPSLLIIATFVLDFLCIHPFRDGNGRVSRLVTTLLLQNHGFQVARYISMERLIEASKEEYYQILGLCSVGWHEGKNEIIPWWNYFLGILRLAYRDFGRQIEFTRARPAKSDLVRQFVLSQMEPFTLAQLIAQFPSASPQLVKKVLSAMKQKGEVQLEGRGRGARWQVVKSD